MSKSIEILAMVLGGLSLFLVCFLGFAALSGKPIASAPGIGQFFSTDDEEEEPADQPMESEESSGVSTADASSSARDRSEAEVVHASIGMMGAWSLPSPYSKTELKSLVEEVKGRLQLLESREQDVLEREAQLDGNERSIRDQFEALETLQARLEAFGSELELREQEVLADESNQTLKAERQWRDVAEVLGTLEPSDAGRRLAEYEPEDAAHILRAMDPDLANEVVNQVPERWKEFVDAYTKLPAGSGRP